MNFVNWDDQQNSSEITLGYLHNLHKTSNQSNTSHILRVLNTTLSEEFDDVGLRKKVWHIDKIF